MKTRDTGTGNKPLTFLNLKESNSQTEEIPTNAIIDEIKGICD